MTKSEAGRLGALKTKEKGINKSIHLESLSEYYKNPHKCFECGKTIPYEKRKNGKFCSQSCNAKYNNRKRGKVIHEKIPHNIFCKNCGIKISDYECDKKYCSIKCKNLFEQKLKFEEAEKKGEFNAGKNGEVSRPFVKSYLINRYGRKCSICGITEWCGKGVPVVVDHIDGNPYNNKINNFRLVCGNCDMQLDTYKNKNRGHGRSYRRIH